MEYFFYWMGVTGAFPDNYDMQSRLCPPDEPILICSGCCGRVRLEAVKQAPPSHPKPIKNQSKNILYLVL